jgi:hypothetical protein
MEHIERYGIGVPRYCHAALKTQFPGLTKQELAERLRVLLTEKRLLRKESLGKSRNVYIRRDDVARTRLSERDGVAAWAMLELCFGDPKNIRKKLTGMELTEFLPQVNHTSFRSKGFYLIEGRLGRLRVDLGGHGRWDRIISYCARDLARLEADRSFAELMRSGYFELTIATCTAQKARRIRHDIARKSLHSVVAIDVVAYPDLLNLVAPPPISAIPPRGF